MTDYDVEISEPAEAEMDDIYYRLLLRSPQAATRLRRGLEEAIASLSQMPGRCPFAPEDGMLDRPIRQLLYRHGGTTYRILFITINATEDDPGIVSITRVRHGAQQHLYALSDQPDED